MITVKAKTYNKYTQEKGKELGWGHDSSGRSPA
jgi:hypothetical protein